MSKPQRTARSVNQRVGNEARARRLTRVDGFVAYVMDRVLLRLGRSSQADEFYLKGGVLVANVLAEPYRFTRDVDLLRKHGTPDPEDIRGRFEKIIAVKIEDGITFQRVSAVATDRASDDYDGVKVLIVAVVEGMAVEVRIDIGFGDAVEPPVERVKLAPFLEDDPPAEVRAYPVETVIAEKVETLLSKFPNIAHRLKDLLDVVVLSERMSFAGSALAASLTATFERRGTATDSQVLDSIRAVLKGRKWARDWSAMLREKSVLTPPRLDEAIHKFDAFVRPVLLGIEGGDTPRAWPPGGPWS